MSRLDRLLDRFFALNLWELAILMLLLAGVGRGHGQWLATLAGICWWLGR